MAELVLRGASDIYGLGLPQKSITKMMQSANLPSFCFFNNILKIQKYFLQTFPFNSRLKSVACDWQGLVTEEKSLVVYCLTWSKETHGMAYHVMM